MDDYPSIADHGLIGDLQTVALVSTDGSVDWFCAPRFDSPSIFGGLLDATEGGRLRVRPADSGFTTKQMYYPDTAVLITRFLTESAVGELVDFMPVLPGRAASPRHRIVRMIRCVRGRMRFVVDIQPRFGYGLERHDVHLSQFGAVFKGAETAMTLHVIRDPEDPPLIQEITSDNGDLRAELELKSGQSRGIVVESGSDGPPRRVPSDEAEGLLLDTVDFWRSWLSRATYAGRWREALLRSVITLKLLTYAPSGGLVAAPTAGLPEQIGGERNWDYRFTWVRDASFSVHSMLRMGFTQEAADFALWLRARVEERRGGDTGPLNIMYRIDGSSDLGEKVLEHWEGYRGSRPVRIGNDAAGQLQLDIYGEALDSLHFADRSGLRIGHDGWLAMCEVLDWLAEHWDQPEEGIWETRGGRKSFTFGRVMSWVALDRGIRLADAGGRPAPLERWRTQRNAIYDQVMARGWHASRRAFVQEYDSDVLDSSLLRMPAVGFVTPTEPRWASTLEAMDDELVVDSLVYRYDPAASPDGLRGSEGTFSLCTFGYVDALARAGRLDEARLVFEKMMTYANHLGLYAEEIAPSGEQIGNFPQAFTHLALVDAALTLDAALTAEERTGGPWARRGLLTAAASNP